MSSERRVLVVGEHDGEDLSPQTFRLIAWAGQIAGNGGVVDLALLGHDIAQLNRCVRDVSVDRALLMHAPEFEARNGEAEVSALVQAAGNARPSVILFGHDPAALEVAPQLATKLGCHVITNCLSVAWDDAALRITRPIFGGSHVVEGEVAEIPVVITVSSPAQIRHPAARSTTQTSPEVIEIAAEVGNLRTTVIETIRAPISDHDIAEASVIVAVGRGVSERAVFELAVRLAEQLDGVVACSRPILDRGWLTADRLVGLSGRSVAPRVYLAFGISGAAQHVAGISDETCVIAVNSDDAAPIFRVANYAVVQDAALILTELVTKTATVGRV